VTPRTFPPAPGWSVDGHRIKAPLVSSRGYDKAWIYGALRVRDGQVLTQTAPSRNTTGYLDLLGALDRDNPGGDLYLITDNRSSHTSGPMRDWLAAHPRVRQVFIPVAACWLNLIEGWWRLVRRAAYAGQSFANRAEIAFATRIAATQLNRGAPVPGSGAVPPHHTARFVVGSSTVFEERRITLFCQFGKIGW
jgi:transposase